MNVDVSNGLQEVLTDAGALQGGVMQLNADLKALQAALVALDQPAPFAPLSQRDPKWSGVTLGFSTHGQTICGYGCTITAVAMWMNYVFKTSINTPLTINDTLKSIQKPVAGYVWDEAHTDQNLIWWPALPTVDPRILFVGKIDCPNTPAPLNVVDGMLAKDLPVIVYVDAQPLTGLQQHFVMITKKRTTTYDIANPWTGTMQTLTPQYGDTPAHAICGIVQLAVSA